MDEQPTCGKGLAARSDLQRKIGELIAALAQVLEFHQRSLDLSDDDGKSELKAYVRLEEKNRLIADLLIETAETMLSYRDLAMTRHDVELLGSADNAEIFARFVRGEEDLLDLLRGALETDQQILRQMRGGRQ